MALLGLPACQKNAPAPKADTKALLVGRWALDHTSGGFTGGGYPLDPNRKQKIIFTASSRAVFLENGAVTSTAVYQLSAGPYPTRPAVVSLNFSPATGFGQALIYHISATELVVGQQVNDGFNLHYVRQ